MNSKYFLVLLGVLNFASFSWSQDLGEWIDSYVKGLAPAKHFRGTIVAEQNGHVIFEKSYGTAVEEWQIPNSRDEIRDRILEQAPRQQHPATG